MNRGIIEHSHFAVGGNKYEKRGKQSQKEKKKKKKKLILVPN